MDTTEWARDFLSSDPFNGPSCGSSIVGGAANAMNPPGRPSESATAEHDARARQQSSIEPTKFYGLAPRLHYARYLGESSQPLPENRVLPPINPRNHHTSPQLPMTNEAFGHCPPLDSFSPSAARAKKRKKPSDTEALFDLVDEATKRSNLGRKSKKRKEPSNIEASPKPSAEASSLSSSVMKKQKRMEPSKIQPLQDQPAET